MRLVLLAAVVGGLVATPAGARPTPADPDDGLVDKVRDAISRGVGFLEKRQLPDGSWEGVGVTDTLLSLLAGQRGGQSALATLALLNCGVKPEEKSVALALAYLRKLPPEKTYVVGLQTMVFAEARQPQDLPLIQRNAGWLLETALGLKAGNLKGWSYPPGGIADNSNTQYAVLGLYAAKQAGAQIDDDVWRAVRQMYDTTQVKTPNDAQGTGGT